MLGPESSPAKDLVLFICYLTEGLSLLIPESCNPGPISNASCEAGLVTKGLLLP